ncbi:lysosomal transcription factor, NCU-G1 domain-containing protein [Phthorimaea operculella]|nr:lysosomal transcription factor, NCU-G1 domain-containing protein [Phthorimaea operculella]
MHIVTFLFVFAISGAYGEDRKIQGVLNPGCSACSNETTLVYIKATGAKDSILQIWDFTRSAPTVIYVIGSVNASLNVTWEKAWNEMIPTKFVLNEKPKYSFAAVVDQPYKNHSLSYMRWERENNTILTDQEAKVVVRGHLKGEKRGSIDLKLDLLPFKDFAVDLPHLIHTANSTLIDISLVNLTLDKEYNASRFALHFVLVSTDDANDKMRYDMRKSLDDEHTPGVFEIVEIKTPESFLKGDGGFMQFRPVAYTTEERGVTTSTNAHVSNFTTVRLPRRSTVERFYSDLDLQNPLVQGIYISFGETGDGFYKQHNYTAWSFTIGYGAPPVEGFSLFVIIIIAIGLGVPVTLALSGVVYLLVRRYRSRHTPQRFTDED